MDFEFLKNLKFSILTFSIYPENEITLPLFTGATIRGGLGYAFKEIICVRKSRICGECDLIQDCVYINLFEPKIKNKEGKNQEIPRPYVIELPGKKNTYKINEKLQFNFILFGKSIKFFPYFLFSFLELGKIGLGKFRQKFWIDEVYQIYPSFKNIFKYGNETIAKVEEKYFEPEFREGRKIKIKFITPTKIKNEGKLVEVPDFYVLLKAILRRISQILYFWCDYKEKYDFSEILKEAEKVKIEKCKLKWVDYKRYSTRQNVEMKIGGIVGEVEYKGEVEKFYPIIKAGSYIHIGKNTSFGLGKYICEV